MVSITRQGFVMHRIASVFRSNKERREKKSVTQELAAASAGIPQAIKNRVRCIPPASAGVMPAELRCDALRNNQNHASVM